MVSYHKLVKVQFTASQGTAVQFHTTTVDLDTMKQEHRNAASVSVGNGGGVHERLSNS